MVSSPLIEIAYKVRQATGSAYLAEKFAIEAEKARTPDLLAFLAEYPVKGATGMFWSSFCWEDTPQGFSWWHAIAEEHGL